MKSSFNDMTAEYENGKFTAIGVYLYGGDHIVEKLPCYANDPEYKSANVFVPENVEYSPNYDFVHIDVIGATYRKYITVPVNGGYCKCTVEY